MIKKMHPTVKQLLTEIEAYRAREHLDKTSFGLLVANNGHLIRRMELGQIPSLETIDRIRAYMKTYSRADKLKQDTSS
jgi:hypothetical protein